MERGKLPAVKSTWRKTLRGRWKVKKKLNQAMMTVGFKPRTHWWEATYLPLNLYLFIDSYITKYTDTFLPLTYV